LQICETGDQIASITINGQTTIVKAPVNQGPIGPQGSNIYIASTLNDEVVNNLPENVKIGDIVVDDGEQDNSRKGNMYKIINIEKSYNYKWVRKSLSEINQINPDDLVILCAYAKESTASEAKYVYVPLTNANGTS